MPRIETTVAMPDGWAFATLHTGLNLESQTISVGYDPDEDSVGLHLGKMFISFTRAQWDALVAAIDSVTIPQAVTA